MLPSSLLLRLFTPTGPRPAVWCPSSLSPRLLPMTDWFLHPRFHSVLKTRESLIYLSALCIIWNYAVQSPISQPARSRSRAPRQRLARHEKRKQKGTSAEGKYNQVRAQRVRGFTDPRSTSPTRTQIRNRTLIFLRFSHVHVTLPSTSR